MGKSLRELLNTFPFENGLNPRDNGPGTIKPEPSNRFTNDIDDTKKWLKETPKIYGTDIVRIMTQTDPHKTKKVIKKTADKVGGAIGGGVGRVIGGVVSKLAEFYPKFPDDWTKGEDGNPTGMQTNFYAGVVNGDYARGFYYNAYHKNSKSKVGQFLQANKTPEQVKNAIVPALKSAAIGLAVGLVAAGVTKLFSNKNKKKGNEGPAQPQKKEKYNNGFFDKDKFNKPYFPSTLLINEGFGEPGYGLSFRNYSRLRQRNFNIGTLNYLEKDGVTIIQDMAPTTDNTQFTDIDKAKGVSDYYSQVLYNNTPQTRNSGNVIVSANMIQNNYLPANALQFVLPNTSGTYITDIKDYKIENALDNKVQNYSRFVDKDGNAFVSFGNRSIRGEYTDNDISKLASLNQRYGSSNTNLLTITKAKDSSTRKLDLLGDPLDDNADFYKWQSQGSTYTKDFIVDRKNSRFGSGDNYSNEIKEDNVITINGGLSQTFGASDTNLLELVIPDTSKPNDYEVRKAGSDTPIAWGKAGTDYVYDRSDINILNITTEETSRFITGSISNDSKLQLGYGDKNVETQIGQQFGDAFISVDVDTTTEGKYQFPYRKVDGTDSFARGNTKAEPVSKQVLNITTEEKSRFFSQTVINGADTELQLGYGDKNVETQIGQQFGDAFISVDVDTRNERQYQFPYKRIGGLDTVARWNTKAEPFSKNVDQILTNDFAFLNTAIQTQINTSPAINPYLTLKQNILENKDDDIVRVSIGGIRFLATLTNLSDKNTSNWDSVKPVGSGVNFYLFNNWERSITFDLTLYAENDAHLSLIWQKVDDVMALTTGRPSGNKGSAYGVYGNIINLKLGNLINEIGFVSDITMNVDNSSPWEIDPGVQLPFVCTISVSFQVVTNLEGDEYAFYGKQSANTGAGTAPASNTGPGENTNAAPTNTTPPPPKPGITPKPDTRKKIQGTNVPDGTNQANLGFRG
jgi:hypothetical protein